MAAHLPGDQPQHPPTPSNQLIWERGSHGFLSLAMNSPESHDEPIDHMSGGERAASLVRLRD